MRRGKWSKGDSASSSVANEKRKPSDVMRLHILMDNGRASIPNQIAPADMAGAFFVTVPFLKAYRPHRL